MATVEMGQRIEVLLRPRGPTILRRYGHAVGGPGTPLSHFGLGCFGLRFSLASLSLFLFGYYRCDWSIDRAFSIANLPYRSKLYALYDI